MYTSGTTGPAKGVNTPYFQTCTNGTVYSRVTPEDTMLVNLPLFHAGMMGAAHACIVAGGRMAAGPLFQGPAGWILSGRRVVQMSRWRARSLLF